MATQFYSLFQQIFFFIMKRLAQKYILLYFLGFPVPMTLKFTDLTTNSWKSKTSLKYMNKHVGTYLEWEYIMNFDFTCDVTAFAVMEQLDLECLKE